MNEAISGLIVAAVTAALVGAIFFWTGKAKRKKIGALRALCIQRGWNYRYDSGSLHHGHHIEGNGWTFEAVSRSSGRESAPGSSPWDHSSKWTSQKESPGRCTFILGSRLLGRGLEDMAAMPVRIQVRWSRYLGEEVIGLQLFSAGERLDAMYILAAKDRPPAAGLLPTRAEELLLAWPQELPLVVRSSPMRLSLQVNGKRLENVDQVARFLELGESLLRD